MRGSGQTDDKLPVIQVARRTCQGQFTHYRLVEGFEFWKFFAVERGGARERKNVEQLSRVKAPPGSHGTDLARRQLTGRKRGL